MNIAGYSRKPGAGGKWSFDCAWSVLTHHDITEDRFYVRVGRWRHGEFLAAIGELSDQTRAELAAKIRQCRAYLQGAMG